MNQESINELTLNCIVTNACQLLRDISLVADQMKVLESTIEIGLRFSASKWFCLKSYRFFKFVALSFEI